MTTIDRAFLDEAVTSGQQVLAIVASLKRLISDESRAFRRRVHLYFAGLLVGHGSGASLECRRAR